MTARQSGMPLHALASSFVVPGSTQSHISGLHAGQGFHIINRLNGKSAGGRWNCHRHLVAPPDTAALHSGVRGNGTSNKGRTQARQQANLRDPGHVSCPPAYCVTPGRAVKPLGSGCGAATVSGAPPTNGTSEPFASTAGGKPANWKDTCAAAECSQTRATQQAPRDASLGRNGRGCKSRQAAQPLTLWGGCNGVEPQLACRVCETAGLEASVLGHWQVGCDSAVDAQEDKAKGVHSSHWPWSSWNVRPSCV